MLLASLCCCAHFLSAADPYIVADDVEGESLEYYKTNRGVIAASEDLGNPSEIIMDGKRITGNTVTATGSDVSGGRDREVQGGYFSNTQPGGKVTISGSLFENNEFTATSYDSSVYCMLAKAPLTVVTDTNFIGNTVRLENTSTSAGTIYGGVMGVNYGYSATFENARFDSNKALGTFRVQGATLEVFTNSSLTVRNSSLTNNYGEALNAARGGGIENYNGSLTVENTSFSGNGVKAVTGTSYGGAIYASETASVSNLTDASFSGNYAEKGYGGAVFIRDGATVNFIATKDGVFTGNYATAAAGGEKTDSRGGFLYMDNSLLNTGKGSYANFDVAAGATVTVGDGSEGCDSIASNAYAVLTKKNSGMLIVNSSMNSYKGTLNVDGGEMQVLNRLAAKSISVLQDASLVLLSGGVTAKPAMYLEAGCDLSFVLGSDFDENAAEGFYLALASVTLSGFDEINDVVAVEYNDRSDYKGRWVVSLRDDGIYFAPEIPEPASVAAAAGVLALALVCACRRRKSR